MRITKNYEKLKNQYENHENHEHIRNQRENHENYENNKSNNRMKTIIKK